MKSAGKARSNGLYRHIRTSKEIIRNLLNDSAKNKKGCAPKDAPCKNPHTISKAGSSPAGTSCFSLVAI